MKQDLELWNIEGGSDTPERIIFINEAIRGLNLSSDFSILDLAGGRGVVLAGLTGLFPKCRATIVDIRNYPHDWYKLKRNVRCVVSPLQEFIQKEDQVYDVVMMLNSYRSWRGKGDRVSVKKLLDLWLAEHAKYFITSGADLEYEKGKISGYDYKGDLQLFKMPLSYV